MSHNFSSATNCNPAVQIVLHIKIESEGIIPHPPDVSFSYQAGPDSYQEEQQLR